MKVKKALKKITEDLKRLEMDRRQMRRDWINVRKRIEEEICDKWEIVEDEWRRNFVQKIIEKVLETDVQLRNFDERMLSVKHEIDGHSVNE